MCRNRIEELGGTSSGAVGSEPGKKRWMAGAIGALALMAAGSIAQAGLTISEVKNRSNVPADGLSVSAGQSAGGQATVTFAKTQMNNNMNLAVYNLANHPANTTAFAWTPTANPGNYVNGRTIGPGQTGKVGLDSTAVFSARDWVNDFSKFPVRNIRLTGPDGAGGRQELAMLAPVTSTTFDFDAATGDISVAFMNTSETETTTMRDIVLRYNDPGDLSNPLEWSPGGVELTGIIPWELRLEPGQSYMYTFDQAYLAGQGMPLLNPSMAMSLYCREYLEGFEGDSLENMHASYVPVPGTLALLGLGTLAIARRRR